MNVVSLALYGTGDLYWGSLVPVILAHHHVWPGWELRLYHDGALYEHPLGEAILQLTIAGAVKLHHAGRGADSRAMLWRMIPCWDSTVDRVVCRDIDCLPCAKDRRLVEAWTTSQLAVHAISDNPAHTGHLMGGMCGFHTQRFCVLTGLRSYGQLLALDHEDPWGERGGDQHHLNRHVWPLVLGNVCEHRLRGQPPDPTNPPQDLEAALKTPLADVDPEAARRSDALLNHLGQAGFDVRKATEAFLSLNHPVNDVVRRAIAQSPKAAEFLSRWGVSCG